MMFCSVLCLKWDQWLHSNNLAGNVGRTKLGDEGLTQHPGAPQSLWRSSRTWPQSSCFRKQRIEVVRVCWAKWPHPWFPCRFREGNDHKTWPRLVIGLDTPQKNAIRCGMWTSNDSRTDRCTWTNRRQSKTKRLRSSWCAVPHAPGMTTSCWLFGFWAHIRAFALRGKQRVACVSVLIKSPEFARITAMISSKTVQYHDL